MPAATVAYRDRTDVLGPCYAARVGGRIAVEIKLDGLKMHPSMRRIIDDVAKYGWHVVAVNPDDDSPIPFSFTVGLWETFDHPELVVFGLSGEAAHRVFSACLERIKEGTPFATDQVRTDVLRNHSVAVFEVAPGFYEQYLGSAIGYYDSLDFPALQLVWPDKANRFPWQPGYDSAYEGSQILLNAPSN